MRCCHAALLKGIKEDKNKEGRMAFSAETGAQGFSFIREIQDMNSLYLLQSFPQTSSFLIKKKQVYTDSQKKLSFVLSWCFVLKGRQSFFFLRNRYYCETELTASLLFLSTLSLASASLPVPFLSFCSSSSLCCRMRGQGLSPVDQVNDESCTVS